MTRLCICLLVNSILLCVDSFEALWIVRSGYAVACCWAGFCSVACAFLVSHYCVVSPLYPACSTSLWTIETAHSCVCHTDSQVSCQKYMLLHAHWDVWSDFCLYVYTVGSVAVFWSNTVLALKMFRLVH